MQSPGPGDKTLWGGEFHRVFFPRFSYKKDICLKQARDTICRVSYARVKDDLPNPVWIIHRQRRLMDMIIFLGGGGVENGSPAVGDKGW